jgi:hypothetical protein
VPAYHKRSQLRTLSGNLTKLGLRKGHVQTHRGGMVSLELLASGVYLVTMRTPYGDETHMSRRLQSCREVYREFVSQVDRAFPSVNVDPQRVTA